MILGRRLQKNSHFKMPKGENIGPAGITSVGVGHVSGTVRRPVWAGESEPEVGGDDGLERG